MPSETVVDERPLPRDVEQDTAPGLICPACCWPLAAGTDCYSCAACGRTFPIRDGVPRFLLDLDPGVQQVQRAFDFEHARFRDSQRVHFRAELVQEFCADAQLPPEWFDGKSALDAGCGSGRWSYALAKMGARVTAVDLTDSGVRATEAALAPFPGCAVYQASISALPFPPASFDFVVSWGVLHHTPDTRAAFERLVPLVKPGGVLYVMLYERVAWRHRFLTDALRAVMRRLPDAWRYRACELLVIRDPRWYRRISPWLKVCDGSAALTDLDRSTLVFDTFDAYSPKYNHLHTQSEVRRWFRDAGFADVTLTHPVKFTAPEAVARWGECGGAVHVRGVRPQPGGTVPSLPRYQPPLPDPAAAPPGPALPPFDRAWRDSWHGVAFRLPRTWSLRVEGAGVTAAPNVAIPPYQLGVHVSSVGVGLPLASRADATVARWLPPHQQAQLEAERPVQIAGRPAVDRRFVLTSGGVRARARFVAFEHAGQLCHAYAVAAWDAPTSAHDEMNAALNALLSTVKCSVPSRTLPAGVHYAWRSRGRALRAARRSLAHLSSLITQHSVLGGPRGGRA